MNNYIRTDGNDQVVEIQLNVLVFQQGDYFVAYCPSVELSSYGDSIEEAKEGFDDVMRNYIDESEKNGTLWQDLQNHGWDLNIDNDKNAAPPQMVELNIPAGLLKKQFNESWRVPVTC
jgi:predicted RNase H-like HicB family nuclease